MLVKCIENKPYHPIIKQFIETIQDNGVEELSIEYYYENEEITGLVFYKGSLLQRVTFVSKIKTSFHDKKPATLLFDIVLPDLKLYRYEEGLLKLVYITRMDLIPDEDKEVYETLTGTPLKTTLETKDFGSHTLFRVANNSCGLILTGSSALIIPDPVKKLMACLELLYHVNSQQAEELGLINHLKILMDAIVSSPEDRDKIIHEFSYNSGLLNLLHHLRLKLCRNGFTRSSQLIDELMYRGCGIQYVHGDLADETTMLHHLNDAYDEKLQIVYSSHPNVLVELFTKLAALQRLYPNALCNIEIIGCDTVPKKENLPVPDNSIKLSSITFSHEKDGKINYTTYDYRKEEGYIQRPPPHDIFPLLYELFQLSRYNKFDLSYDVSSTSHGNYLFYAKAKKNPAAKVDEIRLIAFSLITFQHQREFAIEEPLKKLLLTIEKSLSQANQKAFFNRIIFQLTEPVDYSQKQLSLHLADVIEKHREMLKKLRIDKIILKYQDNNVSKLLEFRNILEKTITIKSATHHSQDPFKSVATATKIEIRELQALSRNDIWAYRIPDFIQSVTNKLKSKLTKATMPPVEEECFVELDLDHSQTVIHPTTGSLDYNYGELTPVHRPFGHNEAGVIIGIMISDLGIGIPIKRLLIIGDLTHSSRGAIRGQECLRINAAIRYAAREKIPIDWYSASFGVQVHRERGVEGLDAAASTLREIVKNCHHKNVQINLIINETNIGAQSYWDSMATIIYETSGILIMTPKGCMALTGPKALTCALYSTVGSEQIEQHTQSLFPKGLQSLSGHELIHGPNSDSMVFAKNLEEAISVLMLHHYYAYLKPNEKIVCQRSSFTEYPKPPETLDLLKVEIDNFLKGFKPNRRVILDYLRDTDSAPPLQFWADAQGLRKQISQQGDLPQEASTIVQEILIGGHSTMVIFTPTGPLTPTDSDIIARALYKASGRMQVLIIGSLSGFNCDPLSMGNRQLLAGAWIGKSMVDHQGPIIIFNLGSLVGGTFVVFNKQLNPYIKILAIEGARVQVIGGKSAAKVVFHSLVVKQALQDERLSTQKKTSLSTEAYEKEDSISQISKEKMKEIEESHKKIRSDVIAEIENKEGIAFDQFHNVNRAKKVRSIDKIISFSHMREGIIETFEELRTGYLKGSSKNSSE